MTHIGQNGSEKIGDLVTIFVRDRWWHANFQINGRQLRKALGTRDKREAKRRAIALEADLLQGKDPSRRRIPSVQEVIDAYVAHLKAEGRKPKTLVKYADVFKRLIGLCEQKAVRTIAAIDLSVLDAYRAGRVAQNRASKTIHTELVVIRQLVRFALTRGMIDADPQRGIKLKRPKSRQQPCWSPEQMDAIIGEAVEPARSAFILLRETGMRVGELIHLTWDDLDLDRGFIFIHEKTWSEVKLGRDGPSLMQWSPKTGDHRAVPMSLAARAVLESLPRHGGWVINMPPTKKYPQRDRQMSDRWLLAKVKKIVKKLGLTGHLHTFRHAFISHALSTGTPEAIVRQWVGHVDSEIIRLYTHVLDDISQQAMQRLSEAKQQRKEGHGGSRRDGVA